MITQVNTAVLPLLNELNGLMQRRTSLVAKLNNRDLNLVDSMHHGFEKMEVDHEIIRCAERINAAYSSEGS